MQRSLQGLPSVGDQQYFKKRVLVVFAPPGLGFFELPPVHGGNHVDPAGKHGLAFVRFAGTRWVIRVRVVNTNDIQIFFFGRQLSAHEFLRRKGEVKPPTPFLAQTVFKRDDFGGGLFSLIRSKKQAAALKRIGHFGLFLQGHPGFFCECD